MAAWNVALAAWYAQQPVRSNGTIRAADTACCSSSARAMVYVPEADIDRLVTEDAGFGDLTTTALGIGAMPGVMRFTARHAMVACATEEAARLLARLGVRSNCTRPAARRRIRAGFC